MDKLSNKIGFASGDMKFNIIRTKDELEKKKKIKNSVNLAKLPDKGAKLQNQIDELEEVLKLLTLESTETASSEIIVKSNDSVSTENNDIKCLSVSSVNTDSKETKTSSASSANTEKKELKYQSGACSVTHQAEKSSQSDDNKKCYPGSSNKSDTTKSDSIPFSLFSSTSGKEKFLSFSDLTPKKAGETHTVVATDSPSFKGYREPKGKTLLTEAKPLLEAKSSKHSSQRLCSSNPLFQTDENSVKKMHHSLLTYPDDSREESGPESLKSSLLLHQKQGLAWLIWREEQDPSGGILADDMGLGKTLSMISLVLKQKERNNFMAISREKFESRGTLIVCLASIIHQWNDEIFKHCEFDALKVLLYHGPKREKDAKKMMSYDVVLTTYNILMSERKASDSSKIESSLFKLKWERIILDEAHTIKNHTSQTAQAIFSLNSFRKWAVTGTPIHNAFKDMYSLVKFLRLSPFDDIKKFKGLTDDKSESSEQRRNLLIKSIVLRRTKEQVDEWGKPLVEMKNKTITLFYVDLSEEERRSYDKLNLKISKRFDQYLDKPSKLRSNASLLVLLLRLQQCCNHLSLLEEELEETDDTTDVTKTLSSLTIAENASACDSLDSGLDLTFNEEVDTLKDPNVKSSKIKELFKKLHEIFESSEDRDKCVIVSQWVSMLKIVELHLEKENIPYLMIAGHTKVDDRQEFSKNFNYKKDGPRIMLLSLKAGGTGLDLIGANHLFLLDLHWNPALEMQACDRIHRVGQKKDVVIHKFICRNTIEEKIKDLQDSKRRIASTALHGVKQNTKGLTFEDFKMLFSVNR